MLGLNLHELVRGAITTVKPDESVLLYKAVGQTNLDGEVKPSYNPAMSIKAQFQPNESNRLMHAEKTGVTTITEQVFLYSDTTLPVAGVERSPIARTGDMINRNGEWWLITAVLEDFSAIGWINVEVTQQLTPPDFSGSNWGDGNG